MSDIIKDYEAAKAEYAKIGIDTDAVIEQLKSAPVAVHCWQGDDVKGFDQDGPLTGGIQTTGNYPGKATNPEQLMADIEKVVSLVPGTMKLNLHACYAIFEDGERVDRDKLEPKHFKKSGLILQRHTIWVLILTRLSFHIPRLKTVLRFQAPTQRLAAFGSSTERLASEFLSILLKKQAFPAL